MMRTAIFLLLFIFSHLNGDEILGSKKTDILIVSTEMGKNRQERKAKLLDEQLSRYNLTSEIVFNLKKENAEETFQGRKLIILDALDGKGGVIKLLREFENILEDTKTPYIALKLNYKKYSNMEDDFAKSLFDYFSEGGKYNFAQGAALLAKKYFNADVEVKPVHVMSDTGIYHPQKGKTTFETLHEYLSALSDEEKSRPMIGIVLHKENITSDDTVIVDTAIQKLEETGITPIAFYTKVGEDDFAGKRFFQIDGKNIIDLIVSFQVMIMDQDNLQKDYEDIGLKVMHGMIYRQGTQEDWENDKQGVPMNWIPMSYTIPEHIGYTDQIIIGALDDESKKTTPIKYQLDTFMNLAINYSKLKHKQNQDKNIAIFYYNYPPGANNFGSSYMRFPESVSNILNNMQKAGYVARANLLVDPKWCASSS
ncbi:MAG TPA: cobaltochelatase subunit CobN, partial [Sulfurimonas sp.]|uniref:cobaltochelatase subunit CobN n=1 Tax=Sulfurimonas sp. TaxID=2022749 RepID=UPI002C839A16